MPYKTNKDLPDPVRKSLPMGAQTIYRKAYNNAVEQYKDPKNRRSKKDTLEEVCAKVAWSAVKQKYMKVKDKWVRI